jgi:hypothetical protein
MRNYPEITRCCSHNSEMSGNVIDDFLMQYAAEKEGYGKHLKYDFDRFKHVTQKTEQYNSFIKAEIIVSKIFTKNGLLKKYLNHSAVKKLPAEQYEFLQMQSQVPWKFSYSVILENPSENYYEMVDVFTEEQYLLYSPSMKLTLQTTNPMLWFNLIGFNGLCWQTYGLVISFNSFSADDIFFFATEVNTSIDNEESLMNEVENNPIPFFMLLIGSEIPLIINDGHLISNLCAEDILKDFSAEPFKKEFDISWNESVFQLKLKKFGEFPHFATAYYDESKKILSRFAMTDFGFSELNKAFENAGVTLFPEPDVSVSLSMIKTAREILKKEISLNTYEQLFLKVKNAGENDEQELARQSKFLDLVIPFVAEGKTPDIKAIALQTGIDLISAIRLWEIVNKHA